MCRTTAAVSCTRATQQPLLNAAPCTRKKDSTHIKITCYQAACAVITYTAFQLLRTACTSLCICTAPDDARLDSCMPAKPYVGSSSTCMQRRVSPVKCVHASADTRLPLRICVFLARSCCTAAMPVRQLISTAQRARSHKQQCSLHCTSAVPNEVIHSTTVRAAEPVVFSAPATVLGMLPARLVYFSALHLPQQHPLPQII
jgi:hypothetical protein